MALSEDSVAVFQGIEPAANQAWLSGGEAVTEREAALFSIAISLKRIADEVCGVPYDHAPDADNSKHSGGLVAGIQLAIEQAISAASNRG